MSLAAAIYKASRLLTDAAAAVAAASVLAMLALVSYAVAMRYLFNSPPIWADELVGYLLVGSVMFAAAEALQRGEHIAIDLLTGWLGPRGRQVAAVMSLVAVLLTALALAVEGWHTAAFSQMLGLMTDGYIVVPLWTLQTMVPVGGLLLLLAALAELLRVAAGLPPEDAPEAGHRPSLD